MEYEGAVQPVQVDRMGCTEFCLDLLNVQALTDVKAFEIEERLRNVGSKNKIAVLALVETHEKYRRVDWGRGLEMIERMRENSDKKGGGLMLLTESREETSMHRWESECRDILIASVELCSFRFIVILVYLDTADLERNRNIYEEMDRTVRKIPYDLPKVILGDFNGHVGFIGHQEMNRKGEMMLEFMEKWDLVMLNASDRCDGVYTRIQGNERSVLDYYLVDERMHDRFVNMKIDEGKETYDLSDHCYISASFWIRTDKDIRNRPIWKREEYYKVHDDEIMEDFVRKVEEKFSQLNVINVREVERIIRNTADDNLKVEVRRKINKKGEITEPPWMNNRIRNEIKYRRELNRKKRRAEGEESLRYLEMYRTQKELVMRLVKEEKTKYEIGVTNEIRDNGSSKKMWKMIAKLRGENDQQKRVKLYNDYGEEIAEVEEEKHMMDYWKQIYQRGESRLEEVWSEDKLREYEEQREEGIRELEINRERRSENEIVGALRLGRIGGIEKWMEDIVFEKRDLEKRIKILKCGKQPGPDGVKPDIYKKLGNSEICKEVLVTAYNRVIDLGEMVDDWRMSKTTMIPKVKKPKAKEHRPIALTNVGYKLFMGMIKDKIVEQCMCDSRVKCLQAGFTEKRRMEENLFILGCCVEESYRTKEQLVVVAVDFCKAFDSVERVALVEALKYYKCEPRVISTIVSLYTGDRTVINRGGNSMGVLQINSGIRQGCTGSPQLFVMVVGKIIEEILRSGMGYRCGGIYIPVMFYADDGLLLARSREEAGEMIDVLERSSEACGLKINRDVGKSKCMIFNGTGNEAGSVRGIQIVEKMKYLGTLITQHKDCFKENRKDRMKLAERMANVAYSVVARSCNRLLIGKTFWKSVVLPGVLNSGQVMVWNKNERLKLQRVENGVWRKVLGAPSYTPVVALQGEVGCSSVEARDIKSKLKFVKFIMESENCILQRMFRRMRSQTQKMQWMRLVEGYVVQVGLDWVAVERMTTNEIVKAVNMWEDNRWRMEVENKSTLIYYRMKEGIGGEWYDNSMGSRLLFQCRSNTLRLGWRARFWGEDVRCGICGTEEETLVHFLMECPTLVRVRERYSINRIEEVMCFEGQDRERAKSFLVEMWKERERWSGNV